jgi:Asp-tRNA(Asn)/Glu-tRNA(Gln) amidotransferase A subunit family amidase
MLQSTTGWLAGWLQVVMPAIRVSGCPVGLGLVGPSGSDEELLKLAAKLDKIVNA